MAEEESKDEVIAVTGCFDIINSAAIISVIC